MKISKLLASAAFVASAPALAGQPAPPPSAKPSPNGSDTSTNKEPRKPGATAQATGQQDIIITAEKKSTSAQRTPVSVTVLGEQQLHDMGARSFEDYAPSVPGLAFQSLAPGEERILLRGVSDGVDTSLRGATQKVTGVYIDDIVVSNNYTSPDLNLFDVDRIEVLKGPQGTLYGDSSVGGLIRVITNKADPREFSAAVEGTGGFIEKGGGDFSLNGMVNVPLRSDELALRVVGQWRYNGGFIDDIVQGINDVNTLKQVGGRASLAWTPTPRLRVTLNGLYQRTMLGGGNDYNIKLGDLKRGTIYRETLDTKFIILNETADYDLGWSSISSSTSWMKFDRNAVSDFTDFLSTIFPVRLPSRELSANHSKTFSEEVRLVTPQERRLRATLGGYYLHFREASFEHDHSQGLFDFFRNDLGFPLEGTPFDVGPDIIFTGDGVSTRRIFAGFGEVTYDLLPKLSATVGARWFDDKLGDQETVGGIVTGNPLTTLEKMTDERGSVFRFRLSSQITPRILVYALASQGYRTGGLNPLNPATINDPTFPVAFAPDKLWNYELGWKTRLLNNHLTLNGAAYLIDWNDMQTEVGLPSGFSIIANAGKARIKGLEIESALNLGSRLTIGLNGSLIDARLARTTPNLGAKGDRLTGVPKEQASGYFQYVFPLARFEGFARGDFQHVGKITRFFETPDVDSYGNYTLINARAGVRRDGLEIALFARNITDKRARLFKGAQATTAPAGRVDVFVAQPRTIGISLSKRY